MTDSPGQRCAREWVDKWRGWISLLKAAAFTDLADQIDALVRRERAEAYAEAARWTCRHCFKGEPVALAMFPTLGGGGEQKWAHACPTDGWQFVCQADGIWRLRARAAEEEGHE